MRRTVDYENYIVYCTLARKPADIGILLLIQPRKGIVVKRTTIVTMIATRTEVICVSMAHAVVVPRKESIPTNTVITME